MRPDRSGRMFLIDLSLAIALVAGSAATGWATAGDPEPQAQTPRPDQPAPDFLFGQPRGWFGLDAGLVLPRAGGELFKFVSNQLTVEKHDFRSPGVNLQGGFLISPRMDAVVGVDMSQANVTSEYRDFVSDDRLPISQATSFDQVNLSGSLKIALLPRGRNISRYVWVPRKIVPYVGGGGGAFYYKFEQAGDFVDFRTFKIFKDTFTSEGWTASGHVFGGADIRIWRALFLNADARYVWAHAQLGTDFVGFDGIDLSGFRLATGLSVALR